jgi:hypothetical protein
MLNKGEAPKWQSYIVLPIQTSSTAVEEWLKKHAFLVSSVRRLSLIDND